MESRTVNPLSRRTFLKASGAGFAAGLSSVMMPSVADPLRIPIGLQLYTLYAELEKDFEGTLRQVAAIGIREVELITFPNRKPANVLRALRNTGLSPVAIHADAWNLASTAQQQIDDACELGVKYFVCSAPVPPDPERLKPASSSAKDAYEPFKRFVASLSLDDWRWNADLFNRLGERTRKAGVQFGYHNHGMEFRRFDGVTAYDELLRRTDPALVTMEMDCGWVESAHADAAEYLRKYPGRFRMLHIKDIKRRTSSAVELEIPTTEVGNGIIDWKRIFSAASQVGVEHYFIEQEPPFERPALESVRMSYDWLHAHAGGVAGSV